MTAKALTEPEREIARMLQAEGRQVTAVAEGRLRTPDVLVDGEPTEFKSLGPGASNVTLRNALGSAKGQARTIVVDARGSGLTETEALRGLRRFLGAHEDRVDSIRVFGEGYEVRHPPIVK
jgi:hypothetical protein